MRTARKTRYFKDNAPVVPLTDGNFVLLREDHNLEDDQNCPHLSKSLWRCCKCSHIVFDRQRPLHHLECSPPKTATEIASERRYTPLLAEPMFGVGTW